MMRLYREALRRQAKLGFTLLFLTLAMVVFDAIFFANGAIYEGYARSIATAVNIAPELMLYVFVAGAGHAFVGFSFLNKRGDSDFYHSLPVKRSTLFFTVCGASATWLAATIFLSAAVSSLVIGGIGVPIVPGHPPLVALFYLAAALLVFTAAAIGCTLTGTRFSNVVLTGLTLFLPRLILGMAGNMIDAQVGVVQLSWLGPLFNPAYHAAAIIPGQVLTGSIASSLHNPGSIVYSLCLSVVELALACRLFIHRPSETAGQGARGQGLQTLFACLCAMPLLLVVALRYSGFINSAILTVLSLACFLIYQLVVTRSLNRVLRSLPWYLCSVATALAILLSTRLMTSAIRNDVPDPEKIATVSLHLGGEGTTSYAAQELRQVQFTDPEIKALAAERLQDSITFFATQRGTRPTGWPEEWVSMEITLNFGRKLIRTVGLGKGELERIQKSNPDYAAALRRLPPDKQILLKRLQPLTGHPILSQQDAERIWQSMKTEYVYHDDNNMSMDGEMTVYAKETMENDSKAFQQSWVCTITATGYRGLTDFRSSYNITTDMPKTAGLFMEMCNHSTEKPTALLAMAATQFAQPLDTLTADMRFGDLSLSVLNLPELGYRSVNLTYGDYGKYAGDGGPALQQVQQLERMRKITEILSRGMPTTNASAVCATGVVNLWSQTEKEGEARNLPYLAFTPQDEAALIALVREHLGIG